MPFPLNCREWEWHFCYFMFWYWWILHIYIWNSRCVFNKAGSNNQRNGLCIYIYRLAFYLGRKAKLQESSESPRAFGSDITSCVFLAREHWDHTRFVIELLCFEHENMLVPTTHLSFLQLFFMLFSFTSTQDRYFFLDMYIFYICIYVGSSLSSH